jgi:hypothetical protein
MPSVASARFEPGIGLTLPSLVYLPIRGPRMIAPASAAQPPTECTTVEPAKSRKPMLVEEAAAPLPAGLDRVDDRRSGRSTKIRNGQSLIRSASAPDTIEAVAAQNISWKKKSDPVEA